VLGSIGEKEKQFTLRIERFTVKQDLPNRDSHLSTSGFPRCRDCLALRSQPLGDPMNDRAFPCAFGTLERDEHGERILGKVRA